MAAEAQPSMGPHCGSPHQRRTAPRSSYLTATGADRAQLPAVCLIDDDIKPITGRHTATRSAPSPSSCHDTIISDDKDTSVLPSLNDELDLLLDETQVEGPWPDGHPLPLPEWAPNGKEPYVTSTVWEYEALAINIELNIQHLLEDHKYNTIGNFIEVYRSFKKDGHQNFSEFFKSYVPPITAEHHTCVGLALELWLRLEKLNSRFPGLGERLFLVSCEESVETVKGYTALGDRIDTVADTLEKEHVMLALKLEVAGRTGVMLCDPGYHVARVITVMQDRAYPHTGWFTQSEEPNLCREYNYTFPNNTTKYIEWTERETRNSIQSIQTALVYVSRPYLSAVDVTERRNLVYDFRSLLSRDTKGHLVAGLYFKVKEGHTDFTLFYQENGRQRKKFDSKLFLYPNELSGQTLNFITECNKQLNLPNGALLLQLHELAIMLCDKEAIAQMLALNKQVNELASDN